METFGYPPKFPDIENELEEKINSDVIVVDKSKGKKVKLQSCI